MTSLVRAGATVGRDRPVRGHPARRAPYDPRPPDAGVVSIFKWMRCNALNTLRPVGCKHSDGVKALGGAENRVEVTGLALVS
jgi:hypothetical protein